jgi:MoaA/NifB/PqqE/SkfB family radical SAM enzyme
MKNWVSNARAIYDRTESITTGFKPAKAYWNWIRANYEMLLRRSRITARPLKLTIDITNACQLHCPLCPTGQKWQDRSVVHMSLETYRHLMEELGEYLFFIDFYNWGEPLLSNQLEEFISIANSKRILTSISTNFSVPLSDERIQQLIESGLTDLIISADGATQETYATYRRGGKFDLVIENIRRFVEQRKKLRRKNPYLTWRYLVFRFNEGEREQAQKIADEIGVDRILFAVPYVDRDRFPDWIPTDSKYNRYIGSDAPSTSEKVLRNKRCDWHYISSAINSDGAIAPCCATFSKKDDFASIDYAAGSHYMKAINSERFVAVRERFAGKREDPVDLVCENCPTPEIMNYSNFVNKMIVFRTAADFLEKFRRFWV